MAEDWEFSGCPGVKTELSLQGALVWSLAGELRSFMLCDVLKKTINKCSRVQQIQFALCIYRCKTQRWETHRYGRQTVIIMNAVIRLWALQIPCFLATLPISIMQFPLIPHIRCNAHLSPFLALQLCRIHHICIWRRMTLCSLHYLHNCAFENS